MNIEGGKKDNQCLKDLWESIKHDNKQVMEIPEVKEIEGNVEKKMYLKNWPSNLMRNINQIPKELNKAWLEWEIHVKYNKNLL